MVRPSTISCLAAVCLCLTAGPAAAFSINTGYSEGCHEGITISAFAVAQAVFPTDNVPVPSSGPWTKLADALIDDTGLAIDSPSEKFLFHSLFAGVRSPDTEGHSALNLASLRSIHAAPEGQYAHCLRAPGDDGDVGDAAAAAGCKRFIAAMVERSSAVAAADPELQIIEVPFSLDHYGEFTVKVWAPAYYLGRAAHALQDSFTHTLRTDDLRRVRHMLNFAEAVGGELEESRDGVAHSAAMDECGPENEPLVAAAIEATADLFRAASIVLVNEDRGEVAAVLDKWVSYEPGCNADTQYCDAAWLSRARMDPTGEVIDSALGCFVVPAKVPLRWPAIGVVGVMAAVLRRRRR